jgi:hypothetical protein
MSAMLAVQGCCMEGYIHLFCVLSPFVWCVCSVWSGSGKSTFLKVRS